MPWHTTQRVGQQSGVPQSKKWIDCFVCLPFLVVTVFFSQSEDTFRSQSEDNEHPTIVDCFISLFFLFSFLLFSSFSPPWMASQDEQLNTAALNGDLEKVLSLCKNPAVDVNWQLGLGFTALYGACREGHVEVVEHLLGHPRINPNLPHRNGATPLMAACQNDHKEVVSLLLADPRIDPNKWDNDQATPLWWASRNDHLVIVKLLLASGREIDTRTRSTLNHKAAAELGKEPRKPLAGPLPPRGSCHDCPDTIETYEMDPNGVRTWLRRELGLPGSFIHFLIPHCTPLCSFTAFICQL